jgi:N-acetylmuramoyl-L-alanine amidase
VKLLYRIAVILVSAAGIAVLSQPNKEEKMRIINDLLPYNDNLEKRDVQTIDMIVLHCTELPTLEEARLHGERIRYKESKTGNSGHYYINRDGHIYRYAADDRVAHHVIGYNQRSIGIEIVNTGRYPHWFLSTHQVPTEEYTQAQIKSVIELITYLKNRYPNISELKRHSDLDLEKITSEDNPGILIRRKIDPGPLFPWEKVLRQWEKVE